MKKNNHLKQQIKFRYANEDSEKLARDLGISVQYLRVLAKRLSLKKGLRTVTNEIVDGKKLCPKCCNTLSVGEFNQDKYQPNNLDYWCRSCRHKSIKTKKETVINNSFKDANNKSKSMAMGIKKTFNPIIKVKDNNNNWVDGLKCKGDFCNHSEKPLSEFYEDKNNVNGYKNVCKYCLKKRAEFNKIKRQKDNS